nr:MAG TPA: hypothetical protein [Caudoviricetes sp.]
MRYMKKTYTMQYSLYNLYKDCSLDLYEIRNHFLDRFYYQDHSRNNARDVMRIVVSSSKIEKLLKKSSDKGIAPNYVDFLSAICGMWRFMLRSNDTQILASIGAALRWDIEVNSKLNLLTQEELKSEVIKVFKKYDVYKEMTEEEFKSVSSYKDSNVSSDSKKNSRHHSNTWSLIAFIKEFGPRMQVGEFTNHDTGEKFKSCVFTQENGTKTFVAFSSKLGVLTEREIADMKEDLAVIKSKTGHYSLIKGRRKAWKDVDV